MSEEEDRLARLMTEVVAALDRAKVPTDARGLGVLKFLEAAGKNSMGDKGQAREMTVFLWDQLASWERKFTFLVEGDRGDEPAKSRRLVGLTILCNGIIHAVQKMLPPLDLPGRYMDYQHLMTIFEDRVATVAALEELGSCRYMFLSEICADPDMHPVKRKIIETRLNDLFCRRNDESLVTILSFRQGCSYVASYGMLGVELTSIIQNHAASPPVLDLKNRVCKIRMLPVDKKGLSENGSANA